MNVITLRDFLVILRKCCDTYNDLYEEHGQDGEMEIAEGFYKDKEIIEKFVELIQNKFDLNQIINIDHILIALRDYSDEIKIIKEMIIILRSRQNYKIVKLQKGVQLLTNILGE